MVELAIEDRVCPKKLCNENAVKSFIEKQLLPAINAQPVDKAHNMYFALQSINEVINIYPFILNFLISDFRFYIPYFRLHILFFIFCHAYLIFYILCCIFIFYISHLTFDI